LRLGVRFVQADGVMTWGGAKVVKSVSGYDVPKLMVGALGTLGVLGELTLRLHPEPEFEATWLAVFTDLAAAQAFVARLVDSTVQPSRVEILNRAGLAACGAGDGPAAVAVSIGTAEEAVRAQGEAVARFARGAGASLRTLVERLRAFVAPGGGGVIIQRAPAAVRAAVDPWGPVEPGALALMRRLKDEFDAKRVLNPGRFVGGL